MEIGKVRKKAEESFAKQIAKERIKELKSQMLSEARPIQALRQSGRELSQASSPTENLSESQFMLSQLFGGGGKIWNLPEEVSTTKVTINHALSPSLNGHTETANLFGFGPQRRVKDDSTSRLFF